MDATRFDSITRFFASRRLSRRQALATGGAGLAAGIAGAAGLAATTAQEATPTVLPAEEKTEFLFVQSFQSGTVAPKDGEAGTYTLILEGGLGQTIYFSDRPERIVGATSTAAFLTGLDFLDDNPPNAALVVDGAGGETEIAVVELFRPSYDEATHTATYEVEVLAEWEDELGVGLTETPTDLAAFGDSFGAAHLFIDDCPNASITCELEYSDDDTQIVGTYAAGACWDWENACCALCNDDQNVLDQGCYQTFSTCTAAGVSCGGYWGCSSMTCKSGCSTRERAGRQHRCRSGGAAVPEERRTMTLVLVIGLAMMLGVLAMQGWLIVHLRDQQARLQLRIDDLARRTSAASPAAAPLPGLASQPAPPFELPSLAGSPTSLATLLAPGKPLVLTFLEPPCGPCYELLPDLGGWQRVYGDRLTVAVVSGGLPAHNQAMTAEYGIAPVTVLLQPDHAVNTAYAIEREPAAVLIQPDGRITAGPVYGAHAVRQLVADALGLVVPEPRRIGSTAVPAVRVGEPAPALRRPDLAGQVVDFAALRGETTLLLFWSPGCGHCQELLPDLREWDQDPDGPRLVVITSGPVAMNKEVGLRAPMVPDDDATIKRAFGVQATPSAVVVDAVGIVASEVARGAEAVRALGFDRVSPGPHAAAES